MNNRCRSALAARPGRLAPIALLALLPLAAPAATQSAPATASAAATVAPDTFYPVLDELAEGIERGSFHGVVAVVELGGERVLDEAFGLRQLAPELPMERDTIFRIYSMTKPVTGVAALLLYDEGELGLDDPVGKYLPALADLSVGVQREPAARPMTVRDLMRHTSGLTYGIFAQSEVDTLVREANIFAPGATLADMVAKLGELPLKHHPGTRFEYSLSSDVLGHLVEVVSGETLDRFFEKRIFAPLKMTDTGFSIAPEARRRLAEVHARGPDGLRPAGEFDAVDPTELPSFLSGGGGLFSTADDYVRFATMLLRGGELDGVRILEPETVALMTRDHLGDIPSGGLLAGSDGFGLGVAVVTEAGGSGPHPGTYWWGGLAGTGFWIDPQAEAVGVFMIQNMMEQGHAMTFRRDVYDRLGR